MMENGYMKQHTEVNIRSLLILFHFLIKIIIIIKEIYKKESIMLLYFKEILYQIIKDIRILVLIKNKLKNGVKLLKLMTLSLR